MARAYYTHFPRTILWLVPGGPFPGEEGMEVEPFYLSKLPITNVQLEAFAPDFRRGALSPGDDDPAVGVDLELARAYAAWYAEVSRKPMRLPTVTEWRYACRGGCSDELFCEPEALGEYAWDAESHPEGETLGVPSLDRRRANPYGLFGLLGGVWEWAVEDGDGRVCGGSIHTPRREIHCDLLRLAPSDLSDVGFRIARGLRR
jgi:formylglycine-generating enzyme required for sulfatase activity